MYQGLSFFLSLIILTGALVPLGAIGSVKNCENGECINALVDKLEDLGKIYRRQCLPTEGMKPEEVESYHQKMGLTEECWKLITEIQHLEEELSRHQARLELRLGCDSGRCPPGPGDDLSSQLQNLANVEQNLSCTPQKKAAIKNQCPSDLTCALASSALGMGGYLAELIVPAKAKPKDCHLGNDSCATQLATGFLKAAITFFEGAWDLLKILGKKAGKKMSEFWNWVSGAEAHSSTSQLAMAKASEDEDVFEMLMNDFSGTMGNIWRAFVGSMKEWVKSDVLCQKWQGIPRFSACEKPTESMDCISCKAIVNGLCSVTGTIVAEIFPAFLTGGLSIAAKQGVNASAKIAKMFSKVSNTGVKAVKESRLARMASESASKTDEALKLSATLKAAKSMVSGALARISRYTLSPARKMITTSARALSKLSKLGKMDMAITASGKILVFSGTVLKQTSNVVLYPISNPLSLWAYKSGQRSFEKVLRLGQPTLASRAAVVSTVAESSADLERLMARTEAARMTQRRASAEMLKLEENLLNQVTPVRKNLLAKSLTGKDPEFDEIIKHLYPELQYGPLAKTLPPERILAAEKEILEQLQKMSPDSKREALLRRFENHIAPGAARDGLLGPHTN
jgi:hypothetical protein